MAMQLNSYGQIQFDATTGLSLQVTGKQSLEQDAASESRCVQGGWFADSTYGRNPFVWSISPSDADRIADINRIVNKYYSPNNISVDKTDPNNPIYTVA